MQPYAGNTQALTTNAADGMMAQEAATEGVDPVMEYTLLGNSVEDRLFEWIAFGVDKTQAAAVEPAVYLYEEGDKANGNAGVGGPGGGAGCGPPTGAFPGGSGRPSTPPSSGVAVTSSSTSRVASSWSAVVATTSTFGASAGGRGCRAGARRH